MPVQDITGTRARYLEQKVEEDTFPGACWMIINKTQASVWPDLWPLKDHSDLNPKLCLLNTSNLTILFLSYLIESYTCRVFSSYTRCHTSLNPCLEIYSLPIISQTFRARTKSKNHLTGKDDNDDLWTLDLCLSITSEKLVLSTRKHQLPSHSTS